MDWRARRVTVLGLGRHGGGVAAARFLAERGALVTISDVADETALAESIARLQAVPIAAIHLGAHRPEDVRTEFVVVNPAVRRDHPLLDTARRFGARLISETELFLAACPARVIGVTGSNGKSTTCTMLHALLSAAGRQAWLGGNIGHSLLGDLARMTADDWVVLELSSFQLAHLPGDVRWPAIAVLTNLSDNHRDWHGSPARYAAAKYRLVARAERAIVGDRRLVRGGDTGLAWSLTRVPPLGVPGRHNRLNAACAAAAAECADVDERTICAVLPCVNGLPHRIDALGTLAGRRIIDDSKATSPAASIAALRAVGGRLWLLAGGDAKGAEFAEWGRVAAARARGIALFGAARQTMAAAVDASEQRPPVFSGTHLRDALAWCWRQSQPGDAILLSPGCASHDQFSDYRQRGRVFRALAIELAEQHGAATSSLAACQ